MKLKLEPQKTSLRLSKEEFEKLLVENHLFQESVFPGGKTMKLNVELDTTQFLSFQDDEISIGLPNRLLLSYRPDKRGLSFKFQCGNNLGHELVFEVDIKRPPLVL
ncbi:MAG: hypothetical protein KDF58_04500 [Alphaproteobacteria bacterium]|nr:hypothetical protein [Alphaproteobacteria bacterium]HPF46135.1 hypothetical protein [Emcibacteraceae bacterium]